MPRCQGRTSRAECRTSPRTCSPLQRLAPRTRATRTATPAARSPPNAMARTLPAVHIRQPAGGARPSEPVAAGSTSRSCSRCATHTRIRATRCPFGNRRASSASDVAPRRTASAAASSSSAFADALDVTMRASLSCRSSARACRC
eukprot:2116522-Prymnesium_polylepis.1